MQLISAVCSVPGGLSQWHHLVGVQNIVVYAQPQGYDLGATPTTIPQCVILAIVCRGEGGTISPSPLRLHFDVPGLYRCEQEEK